MHVIDHINLSAHNYEAEEPDNNCGTANEIQLHQHTHPAAALPVKFECSKDGNMLYVYNAGRVVKILNASGQVVLIQTASKNKEHTVFNIKKLKKGKYSIQAGNRQYIFLKK